jgi:hypothetical protein
MLETLSEMFFPNRLKCRRERKSAFERRGYLLKGKQIMKQLPLWYCALLFTAIASPIFAIKSLEDIAVGGTYHMILTTGDELEGVVESKNDSSLILDSKGNPYTFVCNLIVEYKLIAPPPPSSAGGPASSGPGDRPAQFTYEELQNKKPVGANLEVRIAGGTSFQGSLISIDDEYLKLDVNGSTIPLTKSVITSIATPAAPATDSTKTSKAVIPEVYDTLIIKNPETDDYGKPKENLTLVGKIIKETDKTVFFTGKDNVSGTYTFNQIERIFRHSQENSETELIRRYALPLICPRGMMLVDIPPGKTGRPFLKVCIDKYEFPNKEGTIPRVNVPYAEALALCQQQDKRLCSSQEWQWACSGLEGYSYSYGWVFDKEACNTEGRFPEASGNRNRCIGKFGAMDMVGNVFEWVKGNDGNPAAMGGPLSKCQAVSPGANGDAKPQTGFRCCKSN